MLVITPDVLRDALAASLPVPPLGGVIDVRLAKPAAVVVPIAFAPEPTAFVVLRASHLAAPAGEVGFPGGKPDPGDASLAATALRELAEEVGVGAADVDLVGELRPVPVITGRYVIHPFVGALRAGAVPRVASEEIARVIGIPLVPLITGERRIGGVRAQWRGADVFAPHLALEGCVLYGASAYIFYELLCRVAARLGCTIPPPEVQGDLPWGDRYSR